MAQWLCAHQMASLLLGQDEVLGSCRPRWPLLHPGPCLHAHTQTHLRRGDAPCRRGVMATPRPHRKWDHHPDSSRERKTRASKAEGGGQYDNSSPSKMEALLETWKMGLWPLVKSRLGLTLPHCLLGTYDSEPNHLTCCVVWGWFPLTTCYCNDRKQTNNKHNYRTKKKPDTFLSDTHSLLFSLTAYCCLLHRQVLLPPERWVTMTSSV